MLLFPSCKINIGLTVIGKLSDGFHAIETVMFPVPLFDILEIIISPKGIFAFSTSGLPVSGDAENNLVVKAYELLKKDFDIAPVEIHLHKVIPMGAGLGGGSSDGAFAIKILNLIFNLNLSNEKMRYYAGRLGSDCPFFIENKPVMAKGRGEVFENIELDLSEYYIVTVKPDIHINTAEAYSWVKPAGEKLSIREIINQPVENWKELLINDFEEPVFDYYPEMRAIKEKLYEKGAVYASMTGSGSAVYGIFGDLPDLENDFEGCFFWKGDLSDSYRVPSL